MAMMTDKTFRGSCSCQKISYQVDLPTGAPAPKAPVLISSPNPPQQRGTPEIESKLVDLSMKIAVCHCNNCKRTTGSAFSSNFIVPKSTFTYTAGTPKVYRDSGDTGTEIQMHFCGDCGTTVTSQTPGKENVVIKAGTLDEESRRHLDLGVEIYGKRKDQWVRQLGSVPITEGML
ncbi:Mss4-like protein [Aspergillus leporis]|jgi:hypothetical protein|uniref:Mss4-like protein n=1 Tax=Aspergillus leporis TaxID=41062 RepID=A0A5N5WFU7_9EURO|nr:Mss4-like protein [Aspergillus leporis]